MVDIGTLGGTSSYGYGINNQGEVVGASFTANGQNRAFRWDLLGGMTDLGTLGGILDHTSVANHINDFGQVVGTSYGQGNDYHGFFWEDGLMLDVGVLSGDACSAAQAINNSGEVVGRCGGNRPFIWDSTHGIRALDSGGAVMAGASDINNMSLVVGHIRPTDDSEQRAVLWEGGVMTELDSLIPPSSGWKLSGAEAVNDLGWIAGIGTYEGELCGFLLTPVPEPSSLLALLCGVAGVVWRRRR
jgi:probable HAF family extracellular repeat protein